MKKLTLKNPSFLYLQKSFTEWLDVLGYAETTRYNLPNHLGEFFYYLEGVDVGDISRVTSKSVKQYFEGLKSRSNKRRGGGLSNAFLNKHHQALRLFFRYLASQKNNNVVINTPFEKVDTEELVCLSLDEVAELFKSTRGYNLGTPLECLNYRDRAMLTVFYGCGLRRNEGVCLDVSDIDFDKRLVHVRHGKRYKQRFVPFGKSSGSVLQSYIYDYRPRLLKGKGHNALFLSQRAARMSGQALALRLKLLQQRSDDLGLKEKTVTLHGLRHSIATHLLDSGMSVENIARFLGHSSLQSTQIYTHLRQ